MNAVRTPARRRVSAFGAFALGAAAGSILALLYAPASGKVTRKRIGLKIRTAGKKAVLLRQAAVVRLNGARAWIQGQMRNGHRRPVRQHA